MEKWQVDPEGQVVETFREPLKPLLVRLFLNPHAPYANDAQPHWSRSYRAPYWWPQEYYLWTQGL